MLSNFALKHSSKNGHLEVIKYLGANIHAHDDAALRSASSYGHIEVVKYLEEVKIKGGC